MNEYQKQYSKLNKKRQSILNKRWRKRNAQKLKRYERLRYYLENRQISLKKYKDKSKQKMKDNMYRYLIKRRKFINQFKNRPCMDCLGWFEPCQLDFDHRPDELKCFSISAPRIKKLSEFYKEMKKCDLVCANCHRLRTYRRNQHGASIEMLISRIANSN